VALLLLLYLYVSTSPAVDINYARTTRRKPGSLLKPLQAHPVCGLSAQDADGTSRESILKRCKIGDKLRLVVDECSPDRDTLKVLTLSGDLLGYLRGIDAVDIANRMQSGLPIVAEIIEFWYRGLFRIVHKVDQGSRRRYRGEPGSRDFFRPIGCFIRVYRFSRG
jgi:hypothetical protein